MPSRISIVLSAKDQASGALSRLQDRFRQLRAEGGKPILAGAAADATAKSLDLISGALAGAGDQIQAAIEAASDLNESLSKSRVIFGSSARDIEKWAETMARAGGLSKQAALEASANFGGFFKAAGVATGQAADMSKEIVQLASDLASFNNLDPTEVLDKLRSGLSGEAEPLRRLGVFLSDAKVKAKALEMGLGDAHGELSEGEKILIRYRIILDETRTAQGDFARTSDGLANKQRQLNAELENTRATLGQKLLPIQLEVTRKQLDLLEGVNALASTFGVLTGAADDSAEGLQKQAEAMATGIAIARALKLDTRGLEAALADLIRRQKEAEGQSDSTARADQAWSERLTGLAKAANEAGDETDDAASATRKMTRAAEQAAPTIRDLADSYRDMADAVAGVVTGPAELRGERAGILGRIADVRKELKEARKEGDKLRITELQGELAGLQRDLVGVLAQLAALGDKPAKDELRKWLNEHIDLIETADRETRNLFRILQLLGAVPGSRGRPRSAPIPRQHGGPVGPGVFQVGEAGPETLVLGPSGSGFVMPIGARGSGDGETHIHYHLTVNGSLGVRSESDLLRALRRMAAVR